MLIEIQRAACSSKLDADTRHMIMVMILLNLLRQGHYFLLGFPFFFLMYYFNYQDYQEKRDAYYAVGNNDVPATGA